MLAGLTARRGTQMLRFFTPAQLALAVVLAILADHSVDDDPAAPGL